MTDYEKYMDLAKSTDTEDIVYRLLVRLRREIAGDGPHCRPAGALEHFDAACDRLGIPFLEP